MDASAEALVEVRPAASLAAVVAPHAEIRQRLPPRLAIVRAGPDALQALELEPEVAGVYATDVPAEVLARLDEPERLFAAAWNERRRPKQRRGEGLSWDAPGFEPPDPPDGH